MGHYDSSGLAKTQSTPRILLREERFQYENLSKNGKMSQNRHHHDEELKGLIYEDGLKQLNRVAKS